jgi:hypothetical protein
MTQFKFNYADLHNYDRFSKVLTITDEHGNSSAGKILILQQISDNGFLDRFALIDGNRVGASIISDALGVEINKLPAHNIIAYKRHVEFRYEIIHLPDVDTAKRFYKIFVGDMDNSHPLMISYAVNADETLELIASMSRGKLDVKHIYVIKFELGKNSKYIPILE